MYTIGIRASSRERVSKIKHPALSRGGGGAVVCIKKLKKKDCAITEKEEMTKDRPTTSRHHLAVFRRQGISRPFRPDSPDGTASGDSGASPPSFVFVCTLPLRRGSAPPGRAPGWPTRGEAGYSMPIGSGAASYSYRPAPAPAPAPPCACACLCARE